MISITCALVGLYLGTSYHVKHRSPTTPQIDALTRRRHPHLPLNIHEMSWQRVSRHVRATESHSITLLMKGGGDREYTKCHICVVELTVRDTIRTPYHFRWAICRAGLLLFFSGKPSWIYNIYYPSFPIGTLYKTDHVLCGTVLIAHVPANVLYIAMTLTRAIESTRACINISVHSTVAQTYYICARHTPPPRLK